MESTKFLLRLFACVVFLKNARFEEVEPCDSPVYCYGELLSSVQSMRVFNDSKTFVDMPMVADVDTILMEFDNWTNRSQQGLHEFVQKWFEPPGSDLLNWTPSDWQERPEIVSKIENTKFKEWTLGLNRLWKEFGKQISQSVREFPDQHSLLPVDNPFIAPGGRFTEFYYWDSYWIIKGLLLCGMNDTAKGMIRNLAQLIEWYGFVPNGGRVYYTMRSQPPLLTWMLWEYYNATQDMSLVRDVLPRLDEEYEFWMNRSLLYEECNCIVNQYSSPVTYPRPESYREDVMTASHLPQDKRPELYSNLASGAESGWDFSSRWFQQHGNISSIRTKDIIPVDLNAFIGVNEILLERLHTLTGSNQIAVMYSEAWQERKKNFDELFWNEGGGIWSDRVISSKRHLPGFYASSLAPLYMWTISNNVNITRDRIVHETLTRLGVLDYPGGLPTSLNFTSGQQWDFPNAWSPLQWFMVEAWFNSSSKTLQEAARELAVKWLRSNYAGWLNYNGSMFEKYNCTVVGESGSGGEYVAQSGFGWTNGVALDFLNKYPKSSPSMTDSSSSGLSETGIILVSFFSSLCVCVLLISIPCMVWCRWLYINGKKKYWARVRHEQDIHSSSNSDHQTPPSVYENPGAKEWSDSEVDYHNVDL